ncbi:hypothetical protein D9M71_841830 [compost metagenome]
MSENIVDRVSNGLENSRIAETTMKYTIEERRMKYFGGADRAGIEKQLNESPELLYRVLLSNADSIAILVKSLAYPVIEKTHGRLN